MRLIVDVATDRIVQGASTPDRGGTADVTGRWVFPIPEGAAVTVSETSTLAAVEVDCLAEFLIRYPMYDFIIGNWFREDADLDDIDTTPGSGPLATPERYWMGRGPGVANPGVAPNCLRLPAMNTRASTNQPGQLVIGAIDLAVASGTFPGIPGGTDEVMLWWKLVRLTESDDIIQPYGSWVGSDTNHPAVKTMQEISQVPHDLDVYVSNDDGATWYQAYYLEPIDLFNLDTRFKVAFVNRGDSDIQLLAFCALFPDTWP
jgi:hypothetical protein